MLIQMEHNEERVIDWSEVPEGGGGRGLQNTHLDGVSLEPQRTSSYKSFSKAGGKTDRRCRLRTNGKPRKATADGLIFINAKSSCVPPTAIHNSSI